MSHQSCFPFFVIIVLFVYFFAAFCEESSDPESLGVISSPKQEYAHIFKSIPVLFEYLLVAMQNNPEILESDDVMAFKDFSKRSIREIVKLNSKNEEIVEETVEEDNSMSLGQEDELVLHFNDIVKRDTRDEHNAIDNGYKNSYLESTDQMNHQKSGAICSSKDISCVTEDENHRITQSDDLKTTKEMQKRTADSKYSLVDAEDSEGVDQEAADVYDEVDEDPVVNDASDRGNDDDEETRGLQYTTADVEEMILKTELKLEEYEEE